MPNFFKKKLKPILLDPNSVDPAVHEYVGPILQFESGMDEFNENVPNLTQKMN